MTSNLLLLALLYLVPTAVAFYRQHHQWRTIAVINVLLGWTVIGWIIALAWAVSRTWYERR